MGISGDPVRGCDLAQTLNNLVIRNLILDTPVYFSEQGQDRTRYRRAF